MVTVPKQIDISSLVLEIRHAEASQSGEESPEYLRTLKNLAWFGEEDNEETEDEAMWNRFMEVAHDNDLDIMLTIGYEHDIENPEISSFSKQEEPYSLGKPIRNTQINPNGQIPAHMDSRLFSDAELFEIQEESVLDGLLSRPSYLGRHRLDIHSDQNRKAKRFSNSVAHALDRIKRVAEKAIAGGSGVYASDRRRLNSSLAGYNPKIFSTPDFVSGVEELLWDTFDSLKRDNENSEDVDSTALKRFNNFVSVVTKYISHVPKNFDDAIPLVIPLSNSLKEETNGHNRDKKGQPNPFRMEPYSADRDSYNGKGVQPLVERSIVKLPTEQADTRTFSRPLTNTTFAHSF